MSIPTTEKLAQALEALEDAALTPMIERARAGYYDDFKSPLPTPLIQLYKDLIQAGYPAMAHRVVEGDFDATAEEARTWWEQEGRTIFRGSTDED